MYEKASVTLLHFLGITCSKKGYGGVLACFGLPTNLQRHAKTLALAPTDWQRRANILAGDGLSCFLKKCFG